MRLLSCVILLVGLVGCDMSVCNPCGSGKQSDAQISFRARGQQYFIEDYFIYPDFSSMAASYDNSDSMLIIKAFGGVLAQRGDLSAKSASIAFLARVEPYPSKTQTGLPDTGAILLDIAIPLRYPKVITQNMEGSATIETFPDSSNRELFTDSQHVGVLRITKVDTIKRIFSAIFNFTAVDTLLRSDTVRIDSGTISNMRLR